MYLIEEKHDDKGFLIGFTDGFTVGFSLPSTIYDNILLSQIRHVFDSTIAKVLLMEN